MVLKDRVPAATQTAPQTSAQCVKVSAPAWISFALEHLQLYPKRSAFCVYIDAPVLMLRDETEPVRMCAPPWCILALAHSVWGQPDVTGPYVMGCCHVAH